MQANVVAVIVAIALVTGCAAPQGGSALPPPSKTLAPPDYRLLKGFTEALWIVQGQYVEAMGTRALVSLALRAVDRRMKARGVTVEVTEQAVTVSHREAGADPQTLTLPLGPPDPTTPSEDVDAVARVVAFLEARSGLGLDEVRDALIHGLMDADPEGSYLDLKREFEIPGAATGELGATGLDFTRRGGALTVSSSIDGAPAFRAGVQAGDRIVKIDGVSTQNVSLPDAVRGMRGRAGTKITLTVLRDGWPVAKDIEITRERVRVLPVLSRELRDGIVHVKLHDFPSPTARDLLLLLARLEKDGMKGLILDLRNNPGGALSAAVEVAEIFLEEGRLVAYTEGRVPTQATRFTSSAKRGYRALPMAVLVNRGTAAGSEMVAGALQDAGRARIIGTSTFGRSSIQTIIPLSDGTALRLTTAEWFTPAGRSVRAKGLVPDLTVEQIESPITGGTVADEILARDGQLTAAFAHVRSLVVRPGR